MWDGLTSSSVTGYFMVEISDKEVYQAVWFDRPPKPHT